MTGFPVSQMSAVLPDGRGSGVFYVCMYGHGILQSIGSGVLLYVAAYPLFSKPVLKITCFL